MIYGLIAVACILAGLGCACYLYLTAELSDRHRNLPLEWRRDRRGR